MNTAFSIGIKRVAAAAGLWPSAHFVEGVGVLRAVGGYVGDGAARSGNRNALGGAGGGAGGGVGECE